MVHRGENRIVRLWRNAVFAHGCPRREQPRRDDSQDPSPDDCLLANTHRESVSRAKKREMAAFMIAINSCRAIHAGSTKQNSRCPRQDQKISLCELSSVATPTCRGSSVVSFCATASIAVCGIQDDEPRSVDGCADNTRAKSTRIGRPASIRIAVRIHGMYELRIHGVLQHQCSGSSRLGWESKWLTKKTKSSHPELD